jgi:hypothetical protein
MKDNAYLLREIIEKKQNTVSVKLGASRPWVKVIQDSSVKGP